MALTRRTLFQNAERDWGRASGTASDSIRSCPDRTPAYCSALSVSVSAARVERTFADVSPRLCLGVLLRKLTAGLRAVSHVVVDEIHERDMNVSSNSCFDLDRLYGNRGVSHEDVLPIWWTRVDFVYTTYSSGYVLDYFYFFLNYF